MEIRKVDEIVFREDLYPRFKPNQELIERYANSIEYLPPVKINQANILIDGFHRLTAHKLAEIKEISIELIETASEKELKKLAYQCNSNHGLQLEPKEKQKYAQEMIGEMSIDELKIILSVDEATIFRWTTSQREAIKEERNRRIIELYLRSWNTQQAIAEMLDIERSSISKIVENVKNSHLQEIHKDFKPYLYNIWNLAKMDTQTSHFGAFPQIYMENLLYYHTEPLDIIYDPFAGNGTTVDTCQKWYRRYYCSDLKVKPGREKDIKEWDIANGLPDDLPKPDFAFLDPPYWKQAQGKYSDSPNDLGNMQIDQFNQAMSQLLSSLSGKRIERIAIVIQPTQYANDFVYMDHIFDFHETLRKKYEIEMRYILPYSTQQYNAQMVDKAKEKNRALILHRDLVIWRRNDSSKK